jgi:hypothetical protein
VVGALPEKAVRSAPYRFATLGSDRTEERYPFDPEKASECDKIPTHDRHVFSEGESCTIGFKFYAVFLPDDALEVTAKPLHCREIAIRLCSDAASYVTGRTCAC